jgi:type IV fimbrial biogenesis protein FimT
MGQDSSRPRGRTVTRRERTGLRTWQAGFSATELIMVLAVIGILTAISVPFFISFLRASTLRAGTEELAAVLGEARQLALKDNTSICVTNNGTAVQFRVGTCTGTVWTGPSTDAAGFIRLANNIRVGPTTQNVVFTYIGTASTAGTYTVTNPQDGRTLRVTVASSGRISTGP